MDAVTTETAAAGALPKAGGWFDPATWQPASPLPPVDGPLRSRIRSVLFVASAAAMGLLVLSWANALCVLMQEGMMGAREPSDLSVDFGLPAALYGLGLGTPAFIALLSPSVPRLARVVAALVGLGAFIAYTLPRDGGSGLLSDLAGSGRTWASTVALAPPTVAGAVILVAALPRAIGRRHDQEPAIGGWAAGLLAVPAAALLWVLTAVAEYALRFAIGGSGSRDWSGHRVLADTPVGYVPAVASLVVAGLLYALVLHRRVPAVGLIVSGLTLLAGAVIGLVTVSNGAEAGAGFWSVLSAVPTNGSALLLAVPLLALGVARWIRSIP